MYLHNFLYTTFKLRYGNNFIFFFTAKRYGLVDIFFLVILALFVAKLLNNPLCLFIRLSVCLLQNERNVIFECNSRETQFLWFDLFHLILFFFISFMTTKHLLYNSLCPFVPPWFFVLCYLWMLISLSVYFIIFTLIVK